MKKYLYILLIAPIFSMAQVGINTTTPAAQLDIKSSNQAAPANTDGILIPKIDAFPAINPTSAQRGMMVYLTTASGTNPPGFYYWTSSGWVGIMNDINAWKTTGNSVTNPANNFVGTIDAQPLRFRTGNVFAGQIGNTVNALVSYGQDAGVAVSGGNRITAIGVAAGKSNTSGNDNTYLGANAGAAMTTSFFSTYVGAGAGEFASSSNNALFGYQAGGLGLLTGGLNTFVGSQAGLRNTTGNGNTFMGCSAGSSTTSGSQNVFIGRDAGLAAQTVSASVFIGASAGSDTTVSGNTFVGNSAGRLNTTGNDNAFFGISAGVQNTTGANNTFIGKEAGNTNASGNANVMIGTSANVSNGGLFNATAIGSRALAGNSNVMVLGSISGVNGAVSSVNVGIGTTTPADKLHVVGNIRMVDGNEAAGNVMVSDANGTATWTAPGAATAGTLDQSYDFGGAGAGRTITADAGPVTIAGTDGLTVSGNSGFGVTTPVSRVQLQTASSATKTQFTQALPSSGLLITTDYIANNYTPGLFWSTANNSVTKPKAGVFLRETALGTFMHFGTSNSYVTGITNDAMILDPEGNVGIGITTPATALDLVGAMTVRPFASAALTADNQVVTVGNNGNIWLQSNSFVIGARTITLSDGLIAGQFLTLYNSGILGDFEVADDAINRNTNTAASRTLGNNDVMTLMWNGNDWVEVSYTNN